MTKVEKYIQDYTRGCSNKMAAIEYADGKKQIYYHEWLTPENALSVAEIAKEETLDKVCKFLDGVRLDYYAEHVDELLNDLRKAMEE